jgi:hypothetical protein
MDNLFAFSFISDKSQLENTLLTTLGLTLLKLAYVDSTAAPHSLLYFYNSDVSHDLAQGLHKS